MAERIKTPTRIPIQDPKCEFLQQMRARFAELVSKVPDFPPSAGQIHRLEKWLRLVLNFFSIHVDMAWKTVLVLKIVFSSTSRIRRVADRVGKCGLELSASVIG